MKLNGHDFTQEQLTIEERVDAIALVWGENEIILPAEQAIEIGETLVQYGYHAKTGMDPNVRQQISRQIRDKLATRVALVVKNLEDRNTKPQRIAQEVVDIVLREVL